ncbi:MAG TPA: hypothetical protein VLF19_10180 [Methylomirabilota bacterium]|nr:hypothetical protein [Methylomirabilota bacterium]
MNPRSFALAPLWLRLVLLPLSLLAAAAAPALAADAPDVASAPDVATAPSSSTA